ncbi:hypothetical protein Tco_0025932 [Tanacetum coccineum]
MIDLSYQECKPDTDTENGSSWRCKDSQGGWKLRWLVPRLKVRNGEDFSYFECMLPLKYQLMVVNKTSFPEIECSGSIVASTPDVIEGEKIGDTSRLVTSVYILKTQSK